MLDALVPPRLSTGFGELMISKHPVLSGAVIGAVLWAAVLVILFFSRDYDSVLYTFLHAINWPPGQIAYWFSQNEMKGPVEAIGLVFLPVSFVYWVCIGIAAVVGGRLILGRLRGKE
jgi:hypothetical protein